MSGDPQFLVWGGFWLIELLLVENGNKCQRSSASIQVHVIMYNDLCITSCTRTQMVEMKFTPKVLSQNAPFLRRDAGQGMILRITWS